MQLKEVGEFGLIDIIAKLSAAPPAAVLEGIGDDAAVFQADKKQSLLVTADMLQEGVHFEREFSGPYLLGKKALNVNISDIAAMGGRPLYYFVCLAAAPDTPLDFIKKLYRGLDAQARRSGVFLLGGDTVASRGGLAVSLTLIGSAPPEQIIYRRGARKGDLIFITGFPGDAALGLKLLRTGAYVSSRHALIKKHLDPPARLSEARRIASLGLAGSMIDVSDGLVADLGHILKRSRVGAVVHLGRLPLSRQYKKFCPGLYDDFYQPALCGGEDYELLFTVRPAKRAQLEKLAASFSIPCTCIGEITAKSGGLVILKKDGGRYQLKGKGFAHF